MSAENTNPLCPKCNTPCHKNGFVNSKQRFKCKWCDYQFTGDGNIITPRRLLFLDKMKILCLSTTGFKYRQIERDLGTNKTTVGQIASQPLKVFNGIIVENNSKIRYIGVFLMEEFGEKQKQYPLRNRLIFRFEGLVALFEISK